MSKSRRDFIKLLKLGVISSPFLNSNLFAYEPNEIGTPYVYLEDKYITSLESVRKKLKAIENYVGNGNFNVLGFDEMLKIAKFNSKIGDFTKIELEFLESIFYYNPASHGFYGKQITKNITETINKKEIVKVPYTGHYLFKGKPLETYETMLKDVGNSLTLTSGIRSVVKQTKLFLDKLDSSYGNITVAAKSIAPPAFTYHFVGDFDVGKKGFGHANFTPRFALTKEFQKIRELSYIDVRYRVNNKDGVRYEPWHITTV